MSRANRPKPKYNIGDKIFFRKKEFKITGIIAIKGGYAIVKNNKTVKEYLGGEAFKIAVKDYKNLV